ncbi:MAG: CapA family protein [Candidatus Symbiothrix sp.]|jgi:cell wall-associated NlpC family hydrolase|nr:CapA family protein [Candidatus Symbiothrix sp.]
MLQLKSWTNKFLIINTFLVCSLTSFSQKNSDETEMISIIGTGDIMMGTSYPSSSKLPSGDGKYLFRKVEHILYEADITFGNLEGCFLNSGKKKESRNSDGYYFKMPEHYVHLLSDAGYDVINIANDHIGDFGETGCLSTVKILGDAGLAFAGLKGVCETSVFEKNELKYGFCSFASGEETVKMTDLAYAISLVSELNRTCDVVIVSFHGGAEVKKNARIPQAEWYIDANAGDIREFAHAVIDAGADLVFGHGPHLVRAVELYNDRFIAYSLGNFCSADKIGVKGVNGYAPIIKVFTNKKGVFLQGQIYSALQKDKSGPVLDDQNTVAQEIKHLTQLDFPLTALSISKDGKIERKKKLEIEEPKIAEVKKGTGKIFPRIADIEIEMENEDMNDAFSFVSNPHPKADEIIQFSKKYLGTPYRRGSKGPRSFDCSGFTSFVFNKFGYKLSPGCVTQVNQGTRIDKRELKTGDLIFFKGRNSRSSRVGHVGIVVSNNHFGDVKFIHASRRGIIIDSLESSDYYKARYVTGLRVLSENSNS